jgi:hypothetical protein
MWARRALHRTAVFGLLVVRARGRVFVSGRSRLYCRWPQRLETEQISFSMAVAIVSTLAPDLSACDRVILVHVKIVDE